MARGYFLPYFLTLRNCKPFSVTGGCGWGNFRRHGAATSIRHFGNFAAPENMNISGLQEMSCSKDCIEKLSRSRFFAACSGEARFSASPRRRRHTPQGKGRFERNIRTALQ